MIDINIDDVDGDLVLTSGDITYKESTRKHQQNIMIARKGEYRFAPLATIGIEDYLDDERPEDMLQEIRNKFKLDGMKIDKIEIVGDGKLNILAKYV